jgi:hypothetical protein
MLSLVKHDGLRLRDSTVRAAAEGDCNYRNGQQRSDGTTVNGFHCASLSQHKLFAANTSRMKKHATKAVWDDERDVNS